MRIPKSLNAWLLGAFLGTAFLLAPGWTCDDAFISFRYVDNLVAGHGLVFNAGERVEGYTNFLWVILLAGLKSLGLEPIPASRLFGLIFLGMTIGVVWRTAFRAGVWPIAAAAVALHLHLAVFAKCGLETVMFTFFVTAAVYLLVFAERHRTYGLAGLLLILATMTRPDGAIFYACGSLLALLLTVQSRSAGPLLAYAIPFVVVYVPYFVWKFSYYGYPFPNTFYAKSASDPFVGQGLYYLGVYFAAYWYLIPGLFAPLVLLVRQRGDLLEPGLSSRRGALVLVLFSLPFLGYVAWVGGDFMFSRFCLPVTPVLCLALQRLAPRDWRLLPAVVAASLLTHFAVYPTIEKQFLTPGNPRNVVAEDDHYPAWFVEALRRLGTELAELQPDFRIAVGGAQAMLGYFGRFPYVLEVHGLTDEFIAHREITARGRIGHEKQLPFDHPYYREKKIHLVVGMYQQIAIPNDRLAVLRAFTYHVENLPFLPDGTPRSGPAQATLLHYDSELMTPLIGVEGVVFKPFPEYLDEYLPTMAQRGREAVKKDLAAFRAFYFDHNDDPARLARIRTFLGKND